MLKLVTLSLFLLALVPGMAEAGHFHPTQQQTTTMSMSQGDTGLDTKEFCKGGAHGGAGHHCQPRPLPGHTQPPCLGPHMGPNGVMIQCD